MGSALTVIENSLDCVLFITAEEGISMDLPVECKLKVVSRAQGQEMSRIAS